jgi:multiple sugar transport system substrate-binding protein
MGSKDGRPGKARGGYRRARSGARIAAWLLALSVLAGCGREEEHPLVFAVGGVPAELAVWDSVIAGFTARTGHKVEILRQTADSEQRRQGLLVALRADQPDPDVFLMDVAWISQFAASGWLAAIDSAAEPGARFAGNADSAGFHDGKRMALPIYVDGGLLYYRKDLIEKYGYKGPPETWDELVKMSRRAQRDSERSLPYFYGYVWQGAQYEGLVCNFLEVAASAGGGFAIEGGRVSVNLEPNVKALRFMRDLIRKHGVSPRSTFTEMREEEVRQYFQRGDAFFERNWPYAWALHQAEGSPVKGKVGIAPLPHFPGQSSASTLGGWHAGISRSSDQPAAALALVRYLVSLPVQKRLALALGWNPGRRELYDDPEVLARAPHLKELGPIFDNARARPNLPYYTRLSEVLQRHLNRALAGQVEPAAALEAADAEMKAVTERYGLR